MTTPPIADKSRPAFDRASTSPESSTIGTSSPPGVDPMGPRYRHTQRKAASSRVRCPVCGQEVYSTAGIHPQCAVRREDPPRPLKKKPQVVADPGADQS